MTHRLHRLELSPEFVLMAYRSGYFPMADPRTGAIAWYSPDPRAIIPLEQLRISRSLRRTIRRGAFEVRMDTAFSDVITACAKRSETWISQEIIDAYTRLFKGGVAHSVEAYANGELAGGLYGVSLRGAFFGESMFSRVTDASKVALVALVERLRARNFRLLDSQFLNDHIRSLGGVEIPRAEYLVRLAEALTVNTTFRERE